MKKRILVGGIACIAFAGLLLTGCGAGGEKRESKELSVSVYDRGLISTSEGTYSDNRWTRWIEEETGIKVKWVPVPRNDAKQKLSLLVASGDAPNIITEYEQGFINSLYEQGALLPVDDYIQQYSTVYKEYLQNHPELLPYVTFGDGKMYAFTDKRSIDAIANHGMWIRQDWLDKLGLSAPTTDEELIEVAKAFRDRDPDGNGVNDTLGLSVIQWQEITQAMYQASSLWYLEGDKLVYGPLTDRFADSMALFKTLYDEKLIDEEFITDKDSSNQKQLWVTGKTGILTNNYNTDFARDLMKNDPTARPVPLENISTKYGKNGLWQETAANRYCVFTNTLKDPQTAVEFLDWMIDKGWFTLKFGIEGEHYQLVDNVPQVIDADKNKQELDYSIDYGILTQWNVKTEWIPKMAAKDEFAQKIAALKAQSLETALKNEFRRDIPYEPAVPEFTKINTEFSPIKDKVRMDVIVGGSAMTPEQGLEKLRAEWKRLGGEEVDNAVNKWYQQNKELLTKK